jgi:hypothetical protein
LSLGPTQNRLQSQIIAHHYQIVRFGLVVVISLEKLADQELREPQKTYSWNQF